MHIFSRGSGYPVLFIHGIPTSCHLWDGVIQRMAGEFTCIAIDLPGLGKTAAIPGGFRYLERLAAAIEDVRIQCNIEKWHVVGHDAGCAIAVHYAHRFQERVERLALLTPSMFPDLKPFHLFEILRTPVAGELMAPMINLLFWKFVILWALDWKKELGAAVSDFHAPFRGIRGSWRLMSLMRWGHPAEVLASIPALLSRLLVPTLICHGSKDPVVPEAFARRASGLLAASEVVVLNAGHFLPMNEPGTVAAELLRFFDHHGSLESECSRATAGIAVEGPSPG